MIEPSRYCDGSYFCTATVHIHGCYSDRGECNRPDEHTKEEQMYTIQRFDTDREKWVTVTETDNAVRVLSDRYVSKVVFETDDPEGNG